MASSTSQARDIFVHRVKDGKCVLEITESMPLPERKDMSCEIPVTLNQKYALTQAQATTIRYRDMAPDEAVEVGLSTGATRDFIAHISEATIQSWGLLQQVIDLQEELLQPDFEPTLRNIAVEAQSEYFKNKGSVYQLGFTLQPHYGHSSIQLGPLATAVERWNGQSIVQRISKLANEILVCKMESMGDGYRYRQWHAQASIPFGDPENWNLNAIQLNFTPQGMRLGDGIKQRFSENHPDMHDTRKGFCVALNLSNHTQDFCQGRFLFTAAGVACTLRSREALIMNANFCHCSMGSGYHDLPEGHPLRPTSSSLGPAPSPGLSLSRLLAIVYEEQELAESRLKRFHPNTWGDAPTNILSTKMQHYEWMMRLFTKHESVIWDQLAMSDEVSIPEDVQIRGRMQQGAGPRILQEVSTTFQRFKSEDERETNYMRRRRGYHYYAKRKFPSKLSPEELVMLFSYIDEETGQVCRPSLDTAFNAIACQGKDEELEAMDKEMERLHCGSRFFKNTDVVKVPKPKAGRKRKLIVMEEEERDDDIEAELGNADDGNIEPRDLVDDSGDQKPKKVRYEQEKKEVRWTHGDYHHVFNPKTDLIPSKPEWRTISMLHRKKSE